MPMDDSDFEGTLVLENLAGAGQLEAFSDAVDADDFDRARTIMRRAAVDPEIITAVLRAMAAAD